MNIKIFSLILVAYSLTMGTCIYANSAIEKDEAGYISNQKLLRFIDTRKEYGKSCEEYRYISSIQRLKLLKQDNFMLGDILSDSLSVPNVNPDYLVKNNSAECNIKSIDIS